MHLDRGGGSLYISSALVGQLVGIREEDDERWLFTFMDLDLGHLDTATNTFKPSRRFLRRPAPCNPCARSKTSPICPVAQPDAHGRGHAHDSDSD